MTVGSILNVLIFIPDFWIISPLVTRGGPTHGNGAKSKISERKIGAALKKIVYRGERGLYDDRILVGQTTFRNMQWSCCSMWW
jgi:hypothetical protein